LLSWSSGSGRAGGSEGLCEGGASYAQRDLLRLAEILPSSGRIWWILHITYARKAKRLMSILSFITPLLSAALGAALSALCLARYGDALLVTMKIENIR